MGPDSGKYGFSTDRKMWLWEELLLAVSVSYLFHLVYFLLAPYIWAQNLRFPPHEFTSWIRPWTREHDGIEVYALYILMFGCLLYSLFLSQASLRITGKNGRYLFRAALLVMSGLYFATIGFHPPMNTAGMLPVALACRQALVAAAVVLPILALLFTVQKYAEKALLPTAGALLIPLCFIAIQPISWLDYSFIFAPALRLLHGASLPEIYFQYDLLLSLLAAAWMKLDIDLNLFQLLGQLAYYLLIFSTFIFSRELFSNKNLSLFLFVAMILMKLYANIVDPVTCFQVTPLRLDWWLALLGLVYFLGPYHWSVGLLCGMLIIVHRSFGIIYGAAYCQLLVTLFFLDCFTTGEEGRRGTVRVIIREHMLKSRNNLLLIVASTMVGAVLFGGLQSKSAHLYQKIGIGFIPIAANSFYWYVVMLISLAFILLFRLRRSLSRAYLTTGFFLIYLAIGNSLYFFGRSHENNIINISAALLLLFFLLLDLTERLLADHAGNSGMTFFKSHIGVIVSLVFILSLVSCYGSRIAERVSLQVKNAAARQFIYPQEIPKEFFVNAVSSLKTITGDSKKVYFISHYDFLYYYYGAYPPTGYFSPILSWIFNRELAQFLQGLLDRGYYLAVDKISLINEIGPSLRYTRAIEKYPFIVIWKE